MGVRGRLMGMGIWGRLIWRSICQRRGLIRVRMGMGRGKGW